MNEKKDPLVVCLCPVFNEVEYVERTLKGFVSQETTFPFVAIVHDDASTDGSDKVIRRYAEMYPDIIKAEIEPQGNNQYSKGRLGIKMRELLREYDCKYVAKCEGDDYWINSKKLQMQVDYMDSHPECVMCFTDCHVADQNGKVTKKNLVGKSRIIPTCFEEHLLSAGYIAPPTWLIRSDVYLSLGPYGSVADASLAFALDLFKKGEVHYLDEVTAIYTNREGSMSSQKTIKQQWRYEYGVFETQITMAEKYHCDLDIMTRLKMQGYTQLMLPAIEAGDRKFVKEADQFFTGQGLDMQWFIAKCREYVVYHQQYEVVKKSHAYRLGRQIIDPFKINHRKKR